jgi:hypothetical protein
MAFLSVSPPAPYNQRSANRLLDKAAQLSMSLCPLLSDFAPLPTFETVHLQRLNFTNLRHRGSFTIPLINVNDSPFTTGFKFNHLHCGGVP